MARPEKVAVVDRVSEQMTGAAATLLTDYRGLTVDEMAKLRAELRKAGATYEVVKNTLTRLAAKQADMNGLDELLVGPTALVFCGEDPVGPAKALKAFAKDHDELVIKGGYLDGAVLSAADALQLADLASREELLAQFAGLMQGALANFARLLNAPLAGMARAMGALEGDGGVEAKGFSPEAPAAAAAPAAEDAPADDAPAEEAAADDAEAVAEAVSSASSDSSDSAASADEPAAEADEAPAAEAEEAPEAAADEAPAAEEAPAEDAADEATEGDDETDA